MPTEMTTPRGGGGEYPDTIGHVQNEVNQAISAMKGNMQMMAERDAQLHGMASKTNEFVNSSMRFSRGATQLRRHQEWQRRKLCFIVVGTLLALCWAGAAYFLRLPFRVFGIVLAGLVSLMFSLLLLIQRCCYAEQDDAYQEATPLD
mmetsp:Transcript_89224/g.186474  ORF Transcript_89224/g.186474 Transcript_89224/m.186474 type:complete len:147 (-) Transcript_89224:60-500(-)